jgi:hypothetical protein
MKPSIHPFPARMAPELALRSLRKLKAGVVLDPMTGSGTVARVAKSRGLEALGFDLDPLAVLMSRVGTTPLDDDVIAPLEIRFLDKAKSLNLDQIELPWMDGDPEAERFVSYWFGEQQRDDLRRIAYLLANAATIDMPQDVTNAFKIALSRIIVTKHRAASLAEDTSHSRPHRTAKTSDYDVLEGFAKSVRVVRKRLAGIPKKGTVTIRQGDARDLSSLEAESVDAVLTSPPYLNAIDYMRGHRMSLIWLGHAYKDLTATRSNSIGSERRADKEFDEECHHRMKAAMGNLSALPARYHGMIERYVIDIHQMASEVARVLKSGCRATFVMGDSCLHGVFIRNSEALAVAGEAAGLGRPRRRKRDLPSGSRYLPTPDSGRLAKRMRKEVILFFKKP